MTNKLPLPDSRSEKLSERNCIFFWEDGEMAYTALKRINELKANNKWLQAKIMMSEWML